MRSLIHCIGWGILYGISFIIPPYSLPLFSFLCRISVSSIALIKLMDNLYQTSSIFQAFLKGWMFNAASCIVAFSGIYTTFQQNYPSWLYIPSLLSLGLALGLLASGPYIIAPWGAKKNRFIFSISFVSAFVLGEFLRSHYFIVPFPFNFFSHLFSFDDTHIALCLIQCVKFLSIYALSILWLLFLGSIFYGGIKWIGVTMTSLIGIFIFGHFQLTRPVAKDPSPIRILIVQPNIPQVMKRVPYWHDVILETTCQLTLQAQKNVKEPCDLIIWPECSIQQFISKDSKIVPMIQKYIKGKSLLVFGADRVENSTSNPFIWYNSMYVVSSHKIIDIYDKTKLLPFGEYIPYLRFLSNYLACARDTVNCTPGTPKEIKVNSKLIFHPVICVESIYKYSLSKDALFTVEILNDAWFNLPILWQHLAAARLRTVESGRPTVRVSNTGISGLITAKGELKNMLPIGETQYGVITIPHVR